MNTTTIACLTECALAAHAREIAAATFAMTIAALEAWLRFPISPLFDGYVQSAVLRISSRVSSLITSVIDYRSL